MMEFFFFFCRDNMMEFKYMHIKMEFKVSPPKGRKRDKEVGDDLKSSRKVLLTCKQTSIVLEGKGK